MPGFRHESRVLVCWHESQIFYFWRESRVFYFQKCRYRLRVTSLLNSIASIDGMSPPCSFGCDYRWNVTSSRIWVQVSTKLCLPAKWFCKYRWNVASFLIRLLVSMECHFLVIWVQVSTKSRFLAFSKILFCGNQLSVASPQFLEFEVFWNLGCGYQLVCFPTIFWNFASIDKVSLSFDFWGFGSIEWGSHPSNFWVLRVSTERRFPVVFWKTFFV